MVGPPKTLYDLRKVEASVRVTCLTCKAVKTHELEELIRNQLFARASVDWYVIQREMICTSCPVGDGHSVKVDAIPFGRNDNEMREQRARTLLMNLALTVLQDVARRSAKDDARTPVTRLALRVLRPYLADRSVLMRFWEEAVGGHGGAFSHALLAHQWIVNELVERGHSVWAEFR